MYLLVFYVMGWLTGFALIFIEGGNGFAMLLKGHMAVSIGLGMLFNATGHLFKSEQVAKSIGWVANGFQKELGFVSLGIGLCGVAGYWMPPVFDLPVIIIAAAFLWGAAGIHYREMLTSGNFSPGNTVVMLPDILIPLTTAIFWFLQYLQL